MMRRNANVAAFIMLLTLCAPGFTLACPRHGACHRKFVTRRISKSARIFNSTRIPKTARCEDQASAARYDQGPPDLTVQYGCIEHPEMMSGSLGAMLRGENPAAGAIP